MWPKWIHKDLKKNTVFTLRHTVISKFLPSAWSPHVIPPPTAENAEYFIKLKDLVEEMYNQYQNPVYLLGHSMGCHYVLYFLNHQPQAWKDKYIRGFISLGAPWGGAVKTLRVLSSGNGKVIVIECSARRKWICTWHPSYSKKVFHTVILNTIFLTCYSLQVKMTASPWFPTSRSARSRGWPQPIPGCCPLRQPGLRTTCLSPHHPLTTPTRTTSASSKTSVLRMDGNKLFWLYYSLSFRCIIFSVFMNQSNWVRQWLCSGSSRAGQYIQYIRYCVRIYILS